MSQTLLAILLAVAAAHALPDLARWRDFSWLQVWLARWSREGTGARPAAILLPLLLVVLCGLIGLALQHVLFGLPAFAFAVIVLYYCWGPRDLDADVDAVLKAPDSERRHAAAQALRPDPALAPLPLESAPLVEATFASALSRWFGVLFWFVLLGPAGALGYRAVQLIARHPAFTAEVAAEQRSRLERIALVLDWAPSHLVALTLALVSDFDAVIRTWRDYHAAHGQGYFTLDLGFLGALARAGIDADVVAGDGYAADVDDPLVELADARTVLRRILVVWLVLVALVALAGVGG
ncbi:MAG: regulatory signaling modulator protein AmpE [Rhodanobacteraceae bacterium]|jgi:AmpE protein|nr:regulatory signaling modulator protein AmpE [Rhodanobacteraceae bacterium]